MYETNISLRYSLRSFDIDDFSVAVFTAATHFHADGLVFAVKSMLFLLTGRCGAGKLFGGSESVKACFRTGLSSCKQGCC